MPTKKDPNQFIILKVLVAIIIIILIWFFSWLILDKLVISKNLEIATNEEVRAQFGDKFGAFNSLFSGLAFVGLIFAIYFQRLDLKNQSIMINEQSIMMAKQSFESGFFNLLNSLRLTVNELEVATYKGRDAFNYLMEQLSHEFNFELFAILNNYSRSEIITIRDNRSIDSISTEILSNGEIETLKSYVDERIEAFGKYLDSVRDQHWKYIDEAYITIHKRTNGSYSHYFRSLYVLLLFIDDFNMSDDDKKKYARIIRSQLSDGELISIFYNSISRDETMTYEFGYPKMLKLIKKYDLLQNLSSNKIFHPIHKEIFDSIEELEQ